MVFCEKCDGNHSDVQGACVDIEPRKAYNIASENGESTYRLAVFSRAAVEGVYGPVTPDNAAETASRLTGWGAGSGGAGRWFACEPAIFVRGRNIVVRQYCGLDI